MMDFLEPEEGTVGGATGVPGLYLDLGGKISP